MSSLTFLNNDPGREASAKELDSSGLVWYLRHSLRRWWPFSKAKGHVCKFSLLHGPSLGQMSAHAS